MASPKYKEEHNLPVLDAGRERKKLLALAEKSPEALREYVVSLYSLMFELSRSYQNRLLGRTNAPDSGNFPGDREYPQALSRQRGRGLPGRGGRELAAGL